MTKKKADPATMEARQNWATCLFRKIWGVKVGGRSELQARSPDKEGAGSPHETGKKTENVEAGEERKQDEKDQQIGTLAQDKFADTGMARGVQQGKGEFGTVQRMDRDKIKIGKPEVDQDHEEQKGRQQRFADRSAGGD